jgi:hypothetical protein
VHQQNNCQPCDQLSGERLAQEISVYCFVGPVDSNLLMSVKIGFDLLLEAHDSMCVTMDPLQNPSLFSTSFSDELSLEQLKFPLASRPNPLVLYF